MLLSSFIERHLHGRCEAGFAWYDCEDIGIDESDNFEDDPTPDKLVASPQGLEI